MKEYNRIKNAARKQKRVEDNLMYERQERIHARNQEGSSSSSSSHELHSRGLREDVNDVYSDPLYRVGDLVMILKDTRPGVSYTASYEKEGRVTQVIDGGGTGPNQYHACRTPTSLCDCLLH